MFLPHHYSYFVHACLLCACSVCMQLQEVVAELRDIASWLNDAQSTEEFINSYANVRSSLILSALNSLPEGGTPGGFAIPSTPGYVPLPARTRGCDSF